MRLQCRGLSKVFADGKRQVKAIEHVSFSAESNEFVSIVGPSGSGKTTLLKMIAGLQAPTTGEVVLHDRPGNGRPASAMVFQEHGLFPWMTVLDNVAFGLEMQRVDRRRCHERAMALIRRVGLEHFAHSYPRQLSVGMRQRVGIVRAFVTDPPMLLMDEPFGSLDSQTRRVLQGELLRLWRDRRNIVVFVTHDVDEAVRLSDRILVMSGRPGRIQEEIPVPLPRPRELTRKEPPAISEIKWRIWRLLEAEVRESLGIHR